MSEDQGRLQIDCECPGAGTEPCQNAEGVTDQSVEDALLNTVLCQSTAKSQDSGRAGIRRNQTCLSLSRETTLACSSAYKIICITQKARAR